MDENGTRGKSPGRMATGAPAGWRRDKSGKPGKARHARAGSAQGRAAHGRAERALQVQVGAERVHLTAALLGGLEALREEELSALDAAAVRLQGERHSNCTITH